MTRLLVSDSLPMRGISHEPSSPRNRPATAPVAGWRRTAILSSLSRIAVRPTSRTPLSHPHGSGGLAEIKSRTGARLYAGASDAPLLAAGGRGDFAFGDELTFPPVTVDVPVTDGQRVQLGGVTLRAIATPGHTRGCTSWAFTIEDAGKPLRVLVLGGTTAPGYKLVDNASYPGIAGDFARTFAKLKSEAVDVFLEGHGFAFGLEEKRTGKRSFVDPEGYRARLAEAERAVRDTVQKQRAEQPPAAGR